MARTFLAIVLLLVLVSASDSSGPPPVRSQAVEPEPDLTQARPLPRWPNAEDLARLQSVEGKRKGVVVQVLGHPMRVERRPNGEEVWHYPWSAACSVTIYKGICTSTFYTGGY
jgi:hypothetical protein